MPWKESRIVDQRLQFLSSYVNRLFGHMTDSAAISTVDDSQFAQSLPKRQDSVPAAFAAIQKEGDSVTPAGTLLLSRGIERPLRGCAQRAVIGATQGGRLEELLALLYRTIYC
jgi:hypothetical protein